MPQNPDTLPELTASSPTIRRLRRLYAGVYTSNLESPPEAIVRSHWQPIVADNTG